LTAQSNLYIFYFVNNKLFWRRADSLVKIRKISLEKFAAHIHVPRSTFFRWRQLGLIPDVITAYDIATALGTSVEFLITGEDRKNERLRMEQTQLRKANEVRIKELVGRLQEKVERF